jgi:hypothetical protein
MLVICGKSSLRVDLWRLWLVDGPSVDMTFGGENYQHSTLSRHLQPIAHIMATDVALETTIVSTIPARELLQPTNIGHHRRRAL